MKKKKQYSKITTTSGKEVIVDVDIIGLVIGLKSEEVDTIVHLTQYQREHGPQGGMKKIGRIAVVLNNIDTIEEFFENFYN